MTDEERVKEYMETPGKMHNLLDIAEELLIPSAKLVKIAESLGYHVVVLR